MTDNNRNPNLKHNKAINEKRTILNVPSGLFTLACAFPLLSFFSAGWFPALIVFIVSIPPLVVIHKNDDKALLIYFDKLKRPEFYSGSGVNERKVKVLRRKNINYEVISLVSIT